MLNKKTLIWIIGLLALLLLVSTLVLGYFVLMPLYYHPSQSNIEMLKGTDFVNQNYEVHLSKEADFAMSTLFNSVGSEFAGCLYGNIIEVEDGLNIINITHFQETLLVERTHKDLTFVKCPVDTLITVHSHPNGVCRLSDVDIDLFIDEHIDIQGIVCDKSRYGFFNEKFPKRYMHYEIEIGEV